MKNAFSILLLLSLLLFQYSRILYYQSCRITPLSSTPAVACDCQKQSSEATSGDKQHSTENSISKPRPDDVFLAFALSIPGDATLLPLPDKTDNPSLFPAGYLAVIFQPPRGNVFLPLFI